MVAKKRTFTKEHSQRMLNSLRMVSIKGFALDGIISIIEKVHEKNKDIMELYKSKHLSSYNRYGDLDGQVVFKITPKKVSYWKYSSADGEPYREIFYVDRKMAERIEF